LIACIFTYAIKPTTTEALDSKFTNTVLNVVVVTDAKLHFPARNWNTSGIQSASRQRR
jgi:hypothetical protein